MDFSLSWFSLFLLDLHQLGDCHVLFLLHGSPLSQPSKDLQSTAPVALDPCSVFIVLHRLTTSWLFNIAFRMLLLVVFSS